jgi:hypothetical protein
MLIIRRQHGTSRLRSIPKETIVFGGAQGIVARPILAYQ